MTSTSSAIVRCGKIRGNREWINKQLTWQDKEYTVYITNRHMHRLETQIAIGTHRRRRSRSTGIANHRRLQRFSDFLATELSNIVVWLFYRRWWWEAKGGRTVVKSFIFPPVWRGENWKFEFLTRIQPAGSPLSPNFHSLSKNDSSSPNFDIHFFIVTVGFLGSRSPLQPKTTNCLASGEKELDL